MDQPSDEINNNQLSPLLRYYSANSFVFFALKFTIKSVDEYILCAINIDGSKRHQYLNRQNNGLVCVCVCVFVMINIYLRWKNCLFREYGDNSN